MGALQAVIDDKLNSNKDTNKVPAGIGDCAVVSESDVTKGLLAYTLCVDRYMLQVLNSVFPFISLLSIVVHLSMYLSRGCLSYYVVLAVGRMVQNACGK